MPGPAGLGGPADCMSKDKEVKDFCVFNGS